MQYINILAVATMLMAGKTLVQTARSEPRAGGQVNLYEAPQTRHYE